MREHRGLDQLPAVDGALAELAARAQMTKPSTLETVDALERLGYVERVPDPTDRRAKLIRFTDKSWAAYQGGFRAVIDLQSDWAAKLGVETLDRFFAFLRELNDALSLSN